MKHWKRIGMALLLCLLFAVLAGCNEEEAVSSGSDLSVPEENSAATSSRELLQGTSSGEEASLPEESQPEESQPEESQPEESQPDGNESIDDAELEYLCVYGSFLSGTLEEEVTVQYAEKDGECIFSVPSWEKKYLLPCQTILCGDILGDSAWAITYEGGEKLTVFRATRENQSVEQFEISVGVSLKQPHLLLEVVDENYLYVFVSDIDENGKQQTMGVFRSINGGKAWKSTGIETPCEFGDGNGLASVHFFEGRIGILSCFGGETGNLGDHTYLTMTNGKKWTSLGALPYPVTSDTMRSVLKGVSFEDGKYYLEADVWLAEDKAPVRMRFASMDLLKWYWISEKLDGVEMEFLDYSQETYYALFKGVHYQDTTELTAPFVGEGDPLTYIIRTRRELKKFLNRFQSDIFSYTPGFISLAPLDLFAATENLDSAFFEKNALLITVVNGKYSHMAYGVDYLYKLDGELHLGLEYAFSASSEMGTAYKDPYYVSHDAWCLIATVSQESVASVESYSVTCYEKQYNEVASIGPFIKDHQTPEDISAIPVNRNLESMLKVTVSDLSLIPGGVPKDEIQVKQAGLKIWIVDVNGNHLDYMYTNSEGVAVFIMPRGTYGFYFEGNDTYLPRTSDAKLKCPSSSYSSMSGKYSVHSTTVSTYQKQYEQLKIYVTDVDTGEPIEGVQISYGYIPLVTGETDANGMYCGEGFLRYYGPYAQGSQYYNTRDIEFYAEDYEVYTLEKVSVLETELHVRLKKCVYYDFTVSFVDADTGEPIKGVKYHDFEASWSRKSSASAKESGEDGTIRFVVTKQDLEADHNVTFSYHKTGYIRQPWIEIYFDPAVKEYMIKLRFLEESYEIVE
ncbi:MAG: hypothetical protein IKV50_00845 [Clostridia bacterium]|nr:hypothetical protein [Clostridia bacterium]MBR6553803.1 hypothetical protein [Clostridia bacterium]